jgi:hypothetical protein
MSFLKIDRTEDTPEVIFDGENGDLFIAGISFPENVERFFTPIMMWLDEYSQSPADSTTVIFKFEYFNTSSSKKIFDILAVLEGIKKSGKNVVVKWLYSDDDDDIRSAGIRYSNMVEIPFEFDSY